MKLRPEINLQEIVDYAKQKNVGIFLWCVWHTLDKQLVPAMEMFRKMGIAGLKIDFMDRDDQKVVNFYERTAREAAKHKILVNYHGAFKPTGMNRQYPNIINHESVRGLEYNKFNKEGTTPDHAAHIPFIRMLAGYMDYTPGAMHNASKENWRQIDAQPMGQGTRCQQLAFYTVLEAPLAMLADAPTLYQKEPVILDYLAKIPTTWQDSKPLAGKVGEYALIARRNNNEWYIGGLTNWSARDLTLDFSFLGDGAYTAEIFRDGINADKDGTDYVKTVQPVTKTTQLPIHLAPGGGVAVRIYPAK
jgi:alpha-glucosidase